MSQESVAKALGVHRDTFAKIEQGINDITWNRIVRLASLFQITVEELIAFPIPEENLFKEDRFAQLVLKYTEVQLENQALKQHVKELEQRLKVDPNK